MYQLCVLLICHTADKDIFRSIIPIENASYSLCCVENNLSLIEHIQFIYKTKINFKKYFIGYKTSNICGNINSYI